MKDKFQTVTYHCGMCGATVEAPGGQVLYCQECSVNHNGNMKVRMEELKFQDFEKHMNEDL